MSDINKVNIENELLAILAHNLFDAPYTPSPDIDWEALIAESKKQAVFLLAFKDYKSFPIDESTSRKIECDVKAHMAANMRNFQQNAILHSLMTRSGISYSVIKGLASAHYYPEPLLRGMGDVDFLVAESDIERTRKLLLDEGFVSDKYGENVCHIVFVKKDIHYEMHFDIPGIPYGAVGECVRGELASLISEAKPCFEEFVEYIKPSDFHHGLIMLLHLQHHLLAEGIGLRHLCDFAVFAASFKEGEFEAVFKEKLKACGLWSFACTLTSVCERLGLPHQSFADGDDELASELLADILLGGNFGRKDKQRFYEGRFISNRGKDGVKKSRVRQMFSSLNENARIHMKIVKKVPVLYPVGWCYVSVRYFVLALRGKRHMMNFMDTYKKSGSRKKLYAKLKLFEIDN